MAWMPSACCLVVLLASVSCDRAAPADREEVARLQRLMSAASEHGDRETLTRYIADDFVLSWSNGGPGSFGRFLSKPEVIDRWTSPSSGASTSAVSDQRVVMSGDTAVAFARITDRTETKGAKETSQTWVSDVWVRRAGRWQWLASHENSLH
jgi:ketosteroid isomerase-like protein